MPRQFSQFALFIMLLVCLVFGAVRGEAREKKSEAQGQQQIHEHQKLTASEAAAKARAKHGGKVLKVSPKGRGYRVKLLTDSGRVITVTVKD
jgi:uncharacterized membrane protein YkoI